MPEHRFLVRIRMPDRPGALGLVASRVGAVKGDIVGIEVVDRTEGEAVDELAVVLPDGSLLDALRREISEVDGTVVVAATPVTGFVDPVLASLDLAIAVTTATDRAALTGLLLDAIVVTFEPRWCLVRGSAADAARGEPSEAERTAPDRHATERRPLAPGVELLLARDRAFGDRSRALLDRMVRLVGTAWERSQDSEGPHEEPGPARGGER